MVTKTNSGKYTVFDERGFFNSYEKPGSVTSFDVKQYYMEEMSKKLMINATAAEAVTEGMFNTGRFDDAFAPPDMEWPGRIVKTIDDGTTTVNKPKPVVGGKPNNGKTGNKKTGIGLVFRAFASGKNKSRLSKADQQRLKQIGGGAPIKFTPGGKAYVTKAGTYMGKPGQWTSYQGSGGNTITYFNPADNSPPANFY